MVVCFVFLSFSRERLRSPSVWINVRRKRRKVKSHCGFFPAEEKKTRWLLHRGYKCVILRVELKKDLLEVVKLCQDEGFERCQSRQDAFPPESIR